ncbi:MAG TPA: hypothetical protein VM165_19295, partial [Planctomycetaceae bacterium]|nr:hypothetical protein [Planctomycetaceae bacterium]
MVPESPLQSLQRQRAVVTDRVRGVVHGASTGLYLYGRPGTSKTHTICSTLDALQCRYKYNAGHLTAIGLFELIREYPERVLVLDDVSAVF